MSKLIEKFFFLSDLKRRIEPFLYKELRGKKYLIREVDSIDLLTWNHLNLGINGVIFVTCFCFGYFWLLLPIQYCKIINKTRVICSK